jgi:acetyltransferase-like isoleucine patch superfamily enzyme
VNIDSLYSPVEIGAASIVGQNCVLGYPKEGRLLTEQEKPGSALPGDAVTVGPNCLIGNQVIVHEGVRVGAGCVIDDRTRVGYDSTIGERTRLAYGAYICDRVTVGAGATIAGFICDGAIITVMGELVHEYTSPHEGWWEIDEDPPVVEADSVVGYGARVVGGVRIGPRSYVAAGAVVTKVVPPEHIVTGVNVHTPAAQWQGGRLQGLIRHWQSTPRARR